MAKTPAARVTDTLNFLANTAVATGPQRLPAWQLAQDYANGAFPNPLSPQFRAFSQSMSLGYHFRSDPNLRRKMARALYLLWSAIRHNDPNFTLPAANISAINQATVERALRNYILKAGCVYERQHGGSGAATRALAVLRLNPLDFLRDNKVFVYGSSFLDAAQAPQNVLACKFEYNPHHDRYEFGVRQPAGNGAAAIQVESVTAFHWTDQRYIPRPLVPPPPPLNIATADFGQMTGIQLSGAEPMVTTQFTGCTFAMAEHGGSMYCAHIAPAGVPNMAPNTDGATLAPRVMATGAFANAGGVAVDVYGRGAGTAPNDRGYNLEGGGPTYMTIVGFPAGGSYGIYAQTTRNGAIAEVRQVV